MIDAIKRRVMGMIARAVIEAVDDAGGVQIVQISVLDEEVHDGVERFQNYGFTGVPKAGAEAVVARVGGTNSHGIVIALDDRRYRLKGLEAGEVAIYDDQGQSIILKRDGIVVTTDKPVTVTAETVDVTAERVTIASDDVNLGGAGGQAVARVGDPVVNGFITEGSTKVKSA